MTKKGKVDPWGHRRQTTGMDGQAPDIAGMSFEDALKALEDVVRKLEGGEVPLEESIGLYERGEALRRHCQARLDAAQARIEKIVAGPDGKAAGTVPFDAG
jgi:exodeoxyribonuclease VII small subunit